MQRWVYASLVAGLFQVSGFAATATPRAGQAPAVTSRVGGTVLQRTPWCEADLHARQLTWHGAGGDMVEVELRRGGRALAAGSAREDETGVAHVSLDPVHFSLDEPQPVYLRTGDDLVFAPRAGGSVTVTVPVLAAEVGPTADRVVGMAPAGATVTVTLEDGVSPAVHLQETVVADGDGRLEAFAPSGIALRVGHHGAATLTTAEGHRFTARFAAFQADFTLDSSSVRGRATSGTRVEVAVRRASRFSSRSPPATS